MKTCPHAMVKILSNDNTLTSSSRLSATLDVDECLESLDNCDMNFANCTNTIGSFNCTCIDGFTGDGITCTSKTNFLSVKLK